MSGFEHSQRARLQRTLSDFRTALLAAQDSALLSLTKLDQFAQVGRLAILWAIGTIALALATFVCFSFGLTYTTTAFVFLIVIVVFSLLDSFILSAVFSAVGVGCLNFFFVEPRFTFEVADAEDLIALAAFVIASLVVTALVRRVRSLGEARREQAEPLNLTTDAVFVRDRGDVITQWNRGAVQLYGWERQEAVGKVTHQLLQTVFPAPHAEITEILSRTGRWEGEPLHTTRDGTQVSVASRWSVRRDERGLPIGTLESNTDTTERKRAEVALRQSQAAYLAEAQKLSHTGSFGWNASNGKVFWSEETFRIFGYEPTTSITTEMVLNRVHPDDLALVKGVIDRAATHKEVFDFEHRLQMPDGSVKHLHVVAHALADEPQNLQFAGAVMDITARKVTECALRDSEKRYQNMFQAMAVSLMELDYSRAGDTLRTLHKSGVVDLDSYFRNNVDATRELLREIRVVDVNDQTADLFGRGNKQGLLDSVEPYWPEESWGDFITAVMASFGGDKFSGETRLRRLDGTIFDAHFTMWYASENKARGLVGVVDITARKQVFAELKAGERRYRDLFHYMPIGLVQVDASKLVPLFKELRAQGVTELKTYIDKHPDFLSSAVEALEVEEVNEHTIKLFGAKNAAEMRGPITRYWQPGMPTIRRSIEARYRGQEVFREETKVARMDGSVIDVLFTTARPGAVADKSLVGFIDISERKQAFLDLEKSEQRYRHLFHHTPVALWQLNAQPYVAMFQQLRADGVENLAAYIDSHPEFLSKALSTLIVEEVNDYAIQLFGAQDRKELTDYPTHWMWRESIDTLRRSMESRWRGEVSFQETTKLVSRDGRVIDVLYTVARPRIVEGLSISLVSMIDLTERVRAQEELRRMQADFAHGARISMLGELAASIAHEVNQPLGAISATGQASLRWLAQPVPNIEKLRKLTKDVVADAERASDIISRIRSMAAGRVPEQALLSFDDVVREALLFLRHEVASRGVTVSHLPALVPKKVLGDRTQLQQVIVNLAVNAVQAMAQAGSTKRNLRIRTVAHDAITLRCFVEDSGPGIETHNITRLFDSFFTTKDSGMGMGLRICRSVIEAHGGLLAADNESSQGGARFYFTLPVAITDA